MVVFKLVVSEYGQCVSSNLSFIICFSLELEIVEFVALGPYELTFPKVKSILLYLSLLPPATATQDFFDNSSIIPLSYKELEISYVCLWLCISILLIESFIKFSCYHVICMLQEFCFQKLLTIYSSCRATWHIDLKKFKKF